MNNQGNIYFDETKMYFFQSFGQLGQIRENVLKTNDLTKLAVMSKFKPGAIFKKQSTASISIPLNPAFSKLYALHTDANPSWRTDIALYRDYRLAKRN